MFDIVTVHQRLKDAHIHHPFIDQLEKACSTHVKTGFRGDGSMAFVIKGESGSGKTRVVERVVEQLNGGPQAESREPGDVFVTPMPAVHFRVPTDATTKGAASKMLENLGVRSRSKSSAEDMAKDIRLWAERRKVKLFVIDELHHFVQREGNRPTVITNAANWLKLLLDETNVPMVFVGTEALEPILDHDDGQLRMRVSRTREILPFDYYEKQQREDFRGVVHAFEQAMALPGKSGLATQDMWKRVHIATNGYVGRVFRLLHAAVGNASEMGDMALNRANLGLAYHEGASPSDQKRNPFYVEDIDSLAPPQPKVRGGFQESVKGGKAPKVSANDLVQF